MEKASVEDIEPATFGTDADRRGLSDPLNTSDVAINRYTLEPGQRLAGLHTHVDQEEVFIVVEGETTFETFAPEDGVGGEIAVGAGEAIRFAPGEFQSGKNDSDGEVEIIALGAPRGTEDWRVPVACPECGHDDTRPTVAEDGEMPVLVCPDCEEQSEVECPECGGENMRAILGEDGEPVSVCLDCGAE
jgi:uncharacterized cupin superfamily protein